MWDDIAGIPWLQVHTGVHRAWNAWSQFHLYCYTPERLPVPHWPAHPSPVHLPPQQGGVHPREANPTLPGQVSPFEWLVISLFTVWLFFLLIVVYPSLQVIEPSIADDGKAIATLPIKVSAQCVFSKYSITPPNDINFGALVYGSRKTQALTIENWGEFEIRYTISRMSKNLLVPAQRKGYGGWALLFKISSLFVLRILSHWMFLCTLL